MDTFILNWLISVPLFAAPLLIACLGVIVTARAGVLNLGVEGIMALSAAAGVVSVLQGGSLWWALAVAVLCGMLLSAVFGIATVVFKTDQVLSGLIIVAMGEGLSGVLGRGFTHRPITGFESVDFGFLHDLPWVGPIVFGQDILVYVTVLLVALTGYGVHKTFTGLRLRAVGENPSTADTAGVNVTIYRLGAVIIGGALCGFAGAYLSLSAGQVWVEHMVAGRGWIAIALAIFARWMPWRAVVGALIFGGTEAIIPRIQATGADVPVYFLMMLPYLLTLAVLIIPAITSRGSQDDTPAALLTNYLREDRH